MTALVIAFCTSTTKMRVAQIDQKRKLRPVLAAACSPSMHRLLESLLEIEHDTRRERYIETLHQSTQSCGRMTKVHFFFDGIFLRHAERLKETNNPAEVILLISCLFDQAYLCCPCQRNRRRGECESKVIGLQRSRWRADLWHCKGFLHGSPFDDL